LQVLFTAASDGAQVVRRLQGFARQQADSPLVPCSLAALAGEGLELTRPRWQDEAQRENRALATQCHLGHLPPVMGNPTEIREAFTNLILNAVDAMPDGGTLTIDGSLEPPEASPGAAQAVVVQVTDTGVGMSEEVQRRIFDPFFTTKGVKGTGLGLAVVYGIMERLGGKIEVASSPGRGTTFSLRFQPAPETAPAIPVAAADTPPRSMRRLLVIDDEEPVRKSISELLRAVGHSVMEVGSGEEGLAFLADQRVDLVITDLGMPGMTGWEVVRCIRKLDPPIPVVLLTGWGEQPPEGDTERVPADRLLIKPVLLEELQAVIEDLTAPPRGPAAG
jgi:CheY-like chemotaxis protein